MSNYYIISDNRNEVSEIYNKHHEHITDIRLLHILTKTTFFYRASGKRYIIEMDETLVAFFKLKGIKTYNHNEIESIINNSHNKHDSVTTLSVLEEFTNSSSSKREFTKTHKDKQ